LDLSESLSPREHEQCSTDGSTPFSRASTSATALREEKYNSSSSLGDIHSLRRMDSLCPDNWDDPMDVHEDPDVACLTPEPAHTPSRTSTSPSLMESLVESVANIPREVLEEVARLRRRVSELEDHIRCTDVASLRASLQGSPLGSLPGSCRPFSPSSGPTGRDSLSSTQAPRSPSRWSGEARTRTLTLSSTSSCDKPQKNLSSSSFGSLGGMAQNLSYYELPPSALCQSDGLPSPPSTTRHSLPGSAVVSGIAPSTTQRLGSPPSTEQRLSGSAWNSVQHQTLVGGVRTNPTTPAIAFKPAATAVAHAAHSTVTRQTQSPAHYARVLGEASPMTVARAPVASPRHAAYTIPPQHMHIPMCSATRRWA